MQIPCIAGVLLASTALAQDVTLHLQDAYAPSRAAMSNGAGSIVCMGDSLTFRAGGFHENFRTLVQNRYGNGGPGWQGFSRWTGAGINPGPWTEGIINQDVAPFSSTDGLWPAYALPRATSALASAILPQITLNLTASVADYKAAREVGAGRIVVMGDSLVYRAGGIWDNLVEITQSEYGLAGRGYQGVSVWTGASFSSSYWAAGRLDQDTPPHWSLDGLWVSTSNPSATSTLQMQTWSAQTRLHYVAGPDYGHFTILSGNDYAISVDGYAPSTGVRVLDLDLPVPSFSIITSGNGLVTLLGCDNSRGTGPVVHRVANGGWGLDEVLRRNWTWEPQMQSLNPDLVLVCYGGQNDWAFSWDANVWESYLRQLCDRIHAAVPAAEIILVSNYDSGWHPDITDRWMTLSARQRAVAMDRGYGFIDLLRAGGAYQFWKDQGYLDVDGVHFTDAGGMHAASILYCAIETEGACLANAPCGDTDFNNDGILPDFADLLDFITLFGGGPCVACDPIDYNKDGIWPDMADLDRFLVVFGGGSCL